jgi:hypothetical protein
MSIESLTKTTVTPADVQGLFEDLVNDIANPNHPKSPDVPMAMMRFLAILESASDDMRSYMIEKAGEYTFLQTEHFRKALNEYKKLAIRSR